MNLDDIASLSPDQLGALKARLDSLTDITGRSPQRPRQLHDLTLLPTADDPRPTFFWSAEKPRNAGNLTKTTEFPKLMWHGQTGEEITVSSASMQSSYTSSGYVLRPPVDVVVEPMDLLAAQLDALTESDRTLLVEAQRQDRLNAIRKKLADLPEDKLAVLLAQAEKPARVKKAG